MAKRASKTQTTPADVQAVQPDLAAFPPRPTKLGALTALLQRPQGATLADMMSATGWQAHSVRGALAGALKKKAGLAVTSEKRDGECRYRVEGAA